MNNYPTIYLRPGEADRARSGHPWIYQGQVARFADPIADGAAVQVKDHQRRFLGVGFYSQHSQIKVRLLSRRRIPLDRAFFAQRFQEAMALRQRLIPQATSFRLVNAESDGLSGLIVDKYQDVLVLQMASAGMEFRKADLLAALTDLLHPRAILERNDFASRKWEGLPLTRSVLAGDPAAARRPLRISLNGLQFEVDLLTGHKTGLYLDQQVNYRLISEFAKGRRVLDAFSFLGGFSLHAARAGAVQVLGLDQSPEAVEAARRNASLNGLGDRCRFEAVNVFDWLKAKTANSSAQEAVEPFDLVILDPPSFTRTRTAIPNALRGYKEIHLRALKLLKPSGLLATFCCSHHIGAQLFQQTIVSAGTDAKRLLRRVAIYSQSSDHPVIPAIPETEYLKGYLFEVESLF